MRVPPSAPADVQQAFRDVYAILDALTTGDVDFKQRRIVNAGDAVNASDYLTKRQFDASGSSGAPLVVDEATVKKLLNVFGILKFRQVGLIAPSPGVLQVVRGDGVTIAQIKASAFTLSGAHAYTPTNVTLLRTGDFSALSTDDVRSIVGTLITDLQAAGLLA